MTPAPTRTHLITGVTGQDGILLARLLVIAGHHVVGASHEEVVPPGQLPRQVVHERLDITDAAAFGRLVDRHRPDVVQNLAGHSSVSQSWEDPEQSDEVNHLAVRGLLGVLADRSDVSFVHASSAEIFGPGLGLPASEATPLDPRSPYAEAKAAAHQAVQEARASGLRATNLVLFGHTSELQPVRFALPGVCQAAAAVAKGQCDRVSVHNPDVRRDWGSARDHVRAFALAADHQSGDYVIGTGRLTALGQVIEWALAAAGVEDAPVEVTGSDRPNDHDGLVADCTLANRELGWTPQIPLRDEIERMVRAHLNEF